MKEYRLNRLFNARSGRCLDVAVDHGFFNQPGFLAGIESMPYVIKTLVDAGPDGIQLTIGQVRHLQSIRGREKPSLVLRTDTANVYGRELPDVRFSRMIDETMLQAVRLNPLFPALRSGHRLFQRPSHRKQFPSSESNFLAA